MSLERMLDTLVSLGPTRTEAQAYVFLAKNGPHSGKELANALRITKQQLYRSLRRLRAKGMVNATPQRPAQFFAVSLEKVLELYLKAMIEQAKALQASRKELLSAWRSMIGRILQRAEGAASYGHIFERNGWCLKFRRLTPGGAAAPGIDLGRSSGERKLDENHGFLSFPQVFYTA